MLVVIGFILSLTSGSVSIPLSDIWQLLFGMDSTAISSSQSRIIQELRLPRALAAFATGAMLALSGVMMQVLLRNPLADPYILGISGGAAVGALSVIMLGLAALWMPYAAFTGALFSVLLVFGLAGRRQGWSTTRLLLTGVVISAGWGALINLMLSTSSNQTVHSMLFWLMGDLSQSRGERWHFLLIVVVLALMMAQARPLNAMARGDLQAAALGVNVRRLRLMLYLCASLLTASAVTLAGSIGFVGLIIPHMLRLSGARDHRKLLPGAALLGGSFLMMADSLARTVIAPQQLPVGVLTAMLGVPAFLFILYRGRMPTNTSRNRALP
ncbi:iron ABC transporter permease [Gammaproteobacteria bacterium LSUCC0112]|nr:iron ABC transporter permease [Gammaproteobacteria bacterium LSUCC0112]